MHFNVDIFLNPLTEKDLVAIKLAKKYGVSIFALSFANTSEDVKKLKLKLNKKDVIISKIETRKGFSIEKR